MDFQITVRFRLYPEEKSSWFEIGFKNAFFGCSFL